MAEIQKVEKLSSEAEHHDIAAKLNAMSDEWDRIKKETGKRPKEAFPYTFGLMNGKELVFHAPSENIDVLKREIERLRWL